MSEQEPRLETDRLLLRPFTPEDADDVRRLAGDRAIADTTLNIPHPYEEGMALKWIASHSKGLQTGENLTFAVTLRETGELVGAVSLMVRKEHARAELGYWTGRPYWDRGYCTEASREVIRYGFEEIGLNRIFATHFTRNPASGKVMKKLGMSFEGVQREHVHRNGSYEDLAVYAILRSDTPQAGPRGSDTLRPGLGSRIKDARSPRPGLKGEIPGPA